MLLVVNSRLLAGSLFLVGYRDALATAPGTGIGLGALAPRGQTTSVALSAVAVDFDEALDIETLDTAKVTLDLIETGFLDLVSDFGYLIVAELVNPSFFGDSELVADLGGGGHADTVNISETDKGLFVFR